MGVDGSRATQWRVIRQRPLVHKLVNHNLVNHQKRGLTDKVRRAKLYYLRDLTGKKARIPERRVK